MNAIYVNQDRYEEEIAKKIKRESDAFLFHNQIGRRQNMMLGPPSIGTINTITPCAACKLLRRRCAQECPFSPYFSPHEPHKFASVHKVFGASNVSKMLMEVPESQRADAANSLVYEANVRLRDPVYGCMGAISALQQEVQLLQAELDAIKAEIIKYKYREDDEANISDHNNNNNIVQIMPSSHFNLLSSGVVSIVAPPQATAPSFPPPPTSLTGSSVSSPMYTSASTAATDFSTISNESNSYFG